MMSAAFLDFLSPSTLVCIWYRSTVWKIRNLFYGVSPPLSSDIICTSPQMLRQGRWHIKNLPIWNSIRFPRPSPTDNSFPCSGCYIPVHKKFLLHSDYRILWPSDYVTYYFLWLFCQFPIPLWLSKCLSDSVTYWILWLFHPCCMVVQHSENA